VIHVLRPHQAVRVVVARDVVLGGHPVAQAIENLRIEIPIDELFPHRDPQGAGVDLDGADDVAPPAQRAAIDAVAVGLLIPVRRRLDAEQPGEKAQVIGLPEILRPGDLAVGGAGSDAFAAAGAGFHLQKLAQGIVR